MSAEPMNSIISSGLTNRLWKMTFFSTPRSFASDCSDSRYLSPSRRLM